MFRKSALTAALSLLAVFASAQQNYAQRGTQIRAGIALLDSSQTAGVPSNITPFVWYNLDSNRNAKPAGWNIHNPNAPGTVTPEIQARWALIVGAANAPPINERVTKRHAGYWEFRLSQATETQMANYDVLFINAYRTVALNSIERERLRNFVDRGGVLWIEVSQIDTVAFDDNLINNFPLPFRVQPGVAGVGNLDVFHPVLSYPYSFNIANLNYLNNGNGFGLAQATFAGSSAALNESTIWDWLKLKTVVTQGGVPTMMVGRLGDGFTVVTTRNAASLLNQIRVGNGYVANNQYYAGDVRTGLDRGTDTIGKLVVNMISLGSSSEQPGNGTRKSGSSPVDVSAPLLKRFSQPLAGIDFGRFNSFPVAAYKGLSVVSTNNQIRVYDANPSSDLDGDGNPDDGFPDMAHGQDRDLVWVSNALGSQISAPTCAEIAQPAGTPTDQIMVTQADGTVAVFNAFPTNPTGQILPGPHAPAYTVTSPDTAVAPDTTVDHHGPYAPTVHEGLAYVSSNTGTPLTGQVWVFDPRSGTGLVGGGAARWMVGAQLQPTIQQITAAPTVGYIPIADNSSGLDRVVYVPTRPTAPTGPNAGIYSLWAGTRGESPTSANVLGTTLTVVTRASSRGLWLVQGMAPNLGLGIKLTVLDQFGNPLPRSLVDGLIGPAITQSAPGVLDFNITGVWLPTYTVRVDYTIDWGRGAALSSAIVRGNIFLPDEGARRMIVGNIAMSARGTIYVVHSTGRDTVPAQEGGAFYAFREQGQGAFKCVTRYDAYRRHTINLNQAGPQQVASTLSDIDPLLNLVGILNGTAERLTFVTAPAVRGDFVYAGAVMRKTGGPFPFIGFVQFTTLLTFKAEPEAPEIQVGELSDGFTLVQPDMIRSANKPTPNQMNVATQGQFQYIRESGKIRFDSLMTPNRGQISNCFSLSLPVILRSGGRPDQLIYPDAIAGSRWSPLSWYTVFHGVEEPTAPVVTGGTLFIGGGSALPFFLNGGGPLSGPPPTTGVLFAINSEISERDPFTIPESGRSWNRQVVALKDNGGGNIAANPNIRWPQTQGANTFETWRTRVLQATMPGTARTMSIAAGEGAFFATGGPTPLTAAFGSPGHVFGFSRSDFVVADEGRLGRYDPSGNPIFATDLTNNAGTDVNVGGATSVRAIQRPVRAYPIGTADTVVVDPATNRIVRIDGAGRELRSIESFRMDPATNISLAANEPLTLNNPRDVAVFTEFVANPGGVTGPQAFEYWVHYVIADSGNRRVIDLIDRYEANPVTKVVGDLIAVGGVRQLGVLKWHSPAEYSGKNFEYNAITRYADLSNGVPAIGSPPYYYIVGIGNANPTRVDSGLDNPGSNLPREGKDGNGGIVIFDPVNNVVASVINEVRVPALGANTLIDPSSVGFVGPTWTGNYDPNGRAERQKKLVNLTSVTVRNVDLPIGFRTAIMFTDATGVYEIVQPTPGLNQPWVVDWMLPNEVYKYLRNRLVLPVTGPQDIRGGNSLGLRANYARRLDSGEVLIVNGFVGRTLGGADFSGEVVQVDGSQFNAIDNRGFGFNRPNLGFDLTSLQFELNSLTDTRRLYQPVFADRR